MERITDSYENLLDKRIRSIEKGLPWQLFV